MLGFFWIQTGTKAEKLSKTSLDFSHTCLFFCFLCYVTIADIYWELTMGKVLHVSFTSFISLQRLVSKACMMNILLRRKLRLEEKLLNLLNLRELVMSKNFKSWAQVCLTFNYYVVLLHILSLGLFCLEKKASSHVLFLPTFLYFGGRNWLIHFRHWESFAPSNISPSPHTSITQRRVFVTSFGPLNYILSSLGGKLTCNYFHD